MTHENFFHLSQQLSNTLYEPVHDVEALNQWKMQMNDLIEQISHLKLSTSAMNLKTNNTSLDPTDWSSARTIAYRSLDSAMTCVQSIREQPVWQPIPDEIRSTILEEPCPEEGQPLSSVCNDVFSHVLPYTRGNLHPRFWGWVMGEGTFGGILADMLAATMNINAGGCTHSAVLVEQKVIHWIREIFSFPKGDLGGLVVGSTSIATIVCLAAARRRCCPNVREEGIIDGPQLIVYASTEVHICVGKALELIGLGTKAMHLVPVKDDYSIDIDQLKKTIENDRRNGLMPFCIVGTAGKDVHLLYA